MSKILFKIIITIIIIFSDKTLVINIKKCIPSFLGFSSAFLPCRLLSIFSWFYGSWNAVQKNHEEVISLYEVNEIARTCMIYIWNIYRYGLLKIIKTGKIHNSENRYIPRGKLWYAFLIWTKIVFELAMKIKVIVQSEPYI